MRTKAIGAGGIAVAAGLGAVVIVYALLQSATLRVQDVLAVYREQADYEGIAVTYPADGTVFPPEMVAPTMQWQDENPRCDRWLVRIEFLDGTAPLNRLTREPQWTPPSQDWELIKQRSLERDVRICILGFASAGGVEILSRAKVSIRTSGDEVGAPLFYREVNLPFIDAVKDPSRIRWRFGPISSPQPPPVVLQNLPVCGNCHSFDADGATLAMDVDYANSKGSYVITRVKEEMTLAASDIITWNDYRKEDNEQTFGLLSQISPDGRYVVSTVKDKSVFVPKPGLAFSQLFFPIKGILCIYDRKMKTFSALPGADDPELVQSNPTWSPDGKTIVFARARAYDLKHTLGRGKVLLTREECKEFVEGGKPFLFDLYRIPFNEGKGGTPEPIEGASHNGVSNFFARYSPDGRWIVFCRARSYMLLQPDSELYVIPAEGGTARRLRCNTARMNSWHSFSPNGKWLVFSSKARSDYTQLCLTHIDEDGRTTPPVWLTHLTAPDRAANIPEFVNVRPNAIAKIHEQFLNDYSFVRAGDAFYRQQEPDNAIAEYRNALDLNPDNVKAHQKLGFLLYHVKGRYEEGMKHLTRAVELDPGDPYAQHDLGMALLHQAKTDDAIAHLTEAVRRPPGGLDDQYSPAQLYFHLGQALLLAARSEEAAARLSQALRLAPDHPAAHYRLALALADLDRHDEALKHYARAVRLQPEVDTSPTLHHFLAESYAQGRRFRDALRHEERALYLARQQRDPALVKKIEETLAVYRRLAKPVP